jgi:hypothetical protein
MFDIVRKPDIGNVSSRPTYLNVCPHRNVAKLGSSLELGYDSDPEEALDQKDGHYCDVIDFQHADTARTV